MSDPRVEETRTRTMLITDFEPEGSAEAVSVVKRFLPGEVIGERFRVVRFLGQGGMGQVFEAEDLELAARVALKVIRPELSRSRRTVERFKREVRLARQVTHPNVCRIFDLFQHVTGDSWGRDEHPVLFLTMELLQGETLSRCLRRGGPLQMRQAVPLAHGMCAALDAAHRAGILHLDFKSSNVFLADGVEGTRVVVTDFGLAQARESVESMVRAGTPAYMAPELRHGREPSVASDLYSLGRVLDDMLDDGDLDAAGRDVIGRCLAEDPRRRPPSAMAVITALPDERRLRQEAEQRLRQEAAETRRALGRAQKRRALMAAGLGVALVFAAAMGLLTRRIALEARRADQQAARARDAARVAVAGEWMTRDPTRAALVLLEVEEPGWSGYARAKMREALSYKLALLELRGHRAKVRPAAWSPDGRRFATTSDDGTSRVWNTSGTGGSVVLRKSGEMIWMTVFNHTGDRIASASVDGTVRVWSVTDGQGEALPEIAELFVLGHHDGIVWSLDWSPDDQRLATASDDGTARLWNVETRDEAVVLEGHEGTQFTVRWSPDGQRLATTGQDGTVRIWHAGDPARDPLVLRGHDGIVFSADWSPDGRRLATVSRDGTARIWHRSGRPLSLLRGHESTVYQVYWSPDGTRITTSSQDGTTRVWPVGDAMSVESEEAVVFDRRDRNGRGVRWLAGGRQIVINSVDGTTRVWNADGSGEPLVLQGHGDYVSGAIPSPDGKNVVTTSADGTARLWDLSRPHGPEVLRGHESWVYAARFSPDGRRLVSVSQDETVRVWEDSEQVLLLQGHTGNVMDASWSPDGQRILTTSRDDTARIWSAGGSASPVVLTGHANTVLAGAWSPDATRVATASADRTARIWDVDGISPARVIRHDDTVSDVSWSLDGRRLITAAWNGLVYVWDAEQAGGDAEEPLLVLRGHRDKVHCARLSPDGQRIVSGSQDGTARVWNVDAAQVHEPLVFGGHDGGVAAAAWSPDGARIATASWDGSVRIWNADGSGEPLVLLGHDGPVADASWSPDGQFVVTASEDHTVRVWRLDDVDLKAAVRKRTKICLDPGFREKHLGESETEAYERFAECERSHGRQPDQFP